jgi:hypothetical protein
MKASFEKIHTFRSNSRRNRKWRSYWRGWGSLSDKSFGEKEPIEVLFIWKSNLEWSGTLRIFEINQHLWRIRTRFIDVHLQMELLYVIGRASEQVLQSNHFISECNGIFGPFCLSDNREKRDHFQRRLY